jgi:hypothetical protein
MMNTRLANSVRARQTNSLAPTTNDVLLLAGALNESNDLNLHSVHTQSYQNSSVYI